MPKVGCTIWVFDENRRHYKKDNSGLIWREHWRPEVIQAETSRSWVTPWGKRPKNGGDGIAFAQSEIDQAEFVHEHKYKISDLVRGIRNFETLINVAKAAGYKLPPQFPTN